MTPKQQMESKAPSHTPLAGVVGAVVSPATLVGTWNNTNHATNDIVKIIITAAAGSNIKVEVFGACTPSPCVWGAVAGISYAANVSAVPAVAFSAQYKFSFALVSVVGRLQGKFLDIETFTEFTDGSGRSNLYTADQMTK